MKNYASGLNRIILYTMLCGYIMPGNNEQYSQTLTICADGRVEFTVAFIDHEEEPQICTISPDQAKQILDLIQSCFEDYHSAILLYDAGSCNLMMEYNDGRHKKLENLMLDDPILSDLTEVIVNVLPFRDVKAFGTNETD